MSKQLNLEIEFCVRSGYRAEAVRLAEALERQLRTHVQLNEGTGGVFEVKLNDKLVFTRKESNRLPRVEEIVRVVRLSFS